MIMERTFLNFKHGAALKNFQKFTFLFSILLAFCFVTNADAQRRGGGAFHYSRGEHFGHVPFASHRFFYGGPRFFYGGPRFYFNPFAFCFPFRCFSFYFGGIPYYYYGGSYYIERNGAYETVAPPVGALVESLPKGYEKVVIDGQTYYTKGKVQYKAIMKDGDIWYKVIKSPAKASDSESRKDNQQ
jgi:hypothetical protein